MKILKILRLVLLAAGVICLAAAVAPRVMVQGKPDWMMIVLLAICVIAIPISYVQRIKKQQSEMYLSRAEKGMIIAYIVLWSIFTLISVYGLVTTSSLRLSGLALVFIGASAILNYIILYRLKKNFEAEHPE
ncbi:MAG: hypothetical protein J6Q37_08565 [Bacteroidales bacterium]|nr:hypothetical protein [Bacteroidales bacterium]